MQHSGKKGECMPKVCSFGVPAIMPLAVVLLSIAAFLLCVSDRQSSLCTAVLCVGVKTVHGIWELKGSELLINRLQNIMKRLQCAFTVWSY